MSSEISSKIKELSKEKKEELFEMLNKELYPKKKRGRPPGTRNKNKAKYTVEITGEDGTVKNMGTYATYEDIANNITWLTKDIAKNIVNNRGNNFGNVKITKL
jgi:hypothetical protein